MADNKTVTNTKTSFDADSNPDYVAATDEIGGVDYQEMKIVDGTKGATTPAAVGGGAEANALRVTVANDSTGVLTVDDGGGSLTVDGSVAVSSVSGTVTVDCNSSNVTVDNGAGISAVNIQDGGNSITVDDGGSSLTVDGTVAVSGTVDVSGSSVTIQEPLSIDDNGGSITVDGTVAATQSGTWNINNVSGTVSLPTGAATAANQLPDGHNVTVDNGSGGSAVNIQDGGNVISVDDAGGTLTVDQSTASNLNAQVVGNVAHDAADSGNPVKVGGKAEDYSIAEGALPGPTAVADGDRVDLTLDRSGRVVERVLGYYYDLTALNKTFNNGGSGTPGTESTNSASIDTSLGRYVTLMFTLASSGTPDLFKIFVQASPDNTNFFPISNGPLRSLTWSDTAVSTAKSVAIGFPIAAAYHRIRCVATSVSSTATFTMSNVSLYVRN